MKLISVDEFETRMANNSEYFESLTEEQKKLYLELYSLYSKLVVDFFVKFYRIDEFDKKFQESSLHYQPVDPKNLDLYQYLSSEQLQYIYLRNNLYIERLTEQERQFLLQKLQMKDEQLDEQSIELISKTLLRVIFEGNDFNDIHKINYGPVNSQFMHPNNALVFGFRFDEYHMEEGETQEQWLARHEQQIKQMYSILSPLEIRLKNEYQKPYAVIQYNEFSAKKKVPDESFQR